MFPLVRELPLSIPLEQLSHLSSICFLTSLKTEWRKSLSLSRWKCMTQVTIGTAIGCCELSGLAARVCRERWVIPRWGSGSSWSQPCGPCRVLTLEWFPKPLAPALSGQGKRTRQNAWCVLNRFCLLQPINPTAWEVSDPSWEISVAPFLRPPAPQVPTTPSPPAPPLWPNSLALWMVSVQAFLVLVFITHLLVFALCVFFPWSCFSSRAVSFHLLESCFRPLSQEHISICCSLSDSVMASQLSSCPNLGFTDPGKKEWRAEESTLSNPSCRTGSGSSLGSGP